MYCGNRVSSFFRIFFSLFIGWGRGVLVEVLISFKFGGGGMEALGGMCGLWGLIREFKLGLFFLWELGRGGEGWLGWERVGFRIGKDKERGFVLGIIMGIVICLMEKGIRGVREGLGWNIWSMKFVYKRGRGGG